MAEYSKKINAKKFLEQLEDESEYSVEDECSGDESFHSSIQSSSDSDDEKPESDHEHFLSQKVVEIPFLNSFEKDTEVDCANLRRSTRKTTKISKIIQSQVGTQSKCFEKKIVHKKNIDCDANIEKNDYFLGRNEKINFKWSKAPPKVTNLGKPFCLETGLKENVCNLNETQDFFTFFLNQELINLIVLYTNTKIIVKKLNVEPVLSIEIYGFLGLLLLFGVTKKNSVSISEIWDQNSVHYLNYATASMSRDRFKLICAYITFDDFHTREIRLV